MTLLRLAWRNLMRYRRRTFLLGLVVAYATVVILFFWSFTDGFTESLLAGHAGLLSAPVVVTAPAYQEDPDPEHALPDLGWMGRIRGLPGVEAVAVRLAFPGLLSSAYTSTGVEARGIDPQAEPQVSRVFRHLIEGRAIERPGEVVLGAGVAQRLDVRPGERVVLDAASLAGPQAAGLVLVGVVRSGLAAVDEGLAWLHVDDARRLTGVGTGTEVAVAVARGREREVEQALGRALPPDVRPFGLPQRLGALWEDLQYQRVESAVIGLFLSAFAAVAVVSTVLVSVLQRTREFGVMLAMGMSPRRLAALVVWETVLATGLGWAGGLVAGFALVLWLGRFNVLGPLLAGAYGELFAQLGLPAEVYTTARPIYALYATSTVAMGASLALASPVRRALALQPAGALRSE